jgi:hypothetical protein
MWLSRDRALLRAPDARDRLAADDRAHAVAPAVARMAPGGFTPRPATGPTG